MGSVAGGAGRPARRGRLEDADQRGPDPERGPDGRLPAGGCLRTHRHAQHEAYVVLDGTGVVTIGGTARPVKPGVAVFIPGAALHSVEATGDTELRMAYVLAADSFDDVEYVVGEGR